MGEATSVLADFKRYVELITAELRSALLPLPPGEGRDEGASGVEARSTFADALSRSADAAEQGMRDTIPLVAKKGRASYLGERSAGHQDPGATSSHLLLKTASDSWGELQQR